MVWCFEPKELIFKRNMELEYFQLAAVFKYVLLLRSRHSLCSEPENKAESFHTQS